MSKRKVEAALMPPSREAEEFIAILLWAQTSTCTCPAASYFRKMGKRMVKEHVKEEPDLG